MNGPAKHSTRVAALSDATDDLCGTSSDRPLPDFRPPAIEAMPARYRSHRATLVLIGLTSWINVRFVGELYASDVLLALVCMWSVVAGRLRPSRDIRICFALQISWLLSLIVADFFADTSNLQMFRGWANIAFFAAATIALDYLFADSQSLLGSFVLALGMGNLVGFLLAPTGLAQFDPWKFGLAAPVAFVVLGISTLMRGDSRGRDIRILAVLATLNLVFNYRSQSLVCIGALGLLLLRGRAGKAHRGLTAGRLAIVGLLLTSLAFIYPRVVTAGWLGQTANAKYQTQADGRFGYIVGGRYEILFSSRAIVRSPLLGAGSDPRLPREESVASILRSYGYNYAAIRTPGNFEPGGPIPTHSYLFSAWVTAGLLGGVFWLWVGRGAIRRIAGRSKRLGMSGLLAMLLIGQCWNILFSPFGAQERLLNALTLACMPLVLSGRRTSPR